MDAGMRRANRWRVGAAALVLLLATAMPAHAASSVRTADGAVLTVEEIGGPVRSGDANCHPRALAFTWEDASGIRSGLVAPTLDAAVDESPLLALDPRSGRPILVWSRHDGTAMKLAWARFEAGVWGETRFLTFGPGDDRTPALGTSAAGSYLFWRGDGGAVLHAALDVGTGRLFAPPRALPIAAPGERDGLPRDLRAPRDPSAPQGGMDAPIIIGTNGGTDVPIIIGTNGGTDAPIIIGTNGGTDAPIIIGTNGASGSSSSQSLAVFSDPSCANQILLFGSPLGRVLDVVEFAGSGRVAPLGRVMIPDGVAPADAVASAGSRFLDASCR